MKQLSSTLSKPRRRIYSLLTVGLVVAGIATAVGGLIVVLGHSSPDVTLPFWECGEYVLLLSLVNLGIYGAVFWQMGRLTRREGRRATGQEPASINVGETGASPELKTGPVQEKLPVVPPRVSRQVRGTVSSLKLDA